MQAAFIRICLKLAGWLALLLVIIAGYRFFEIGHLVDDLRTTISVIGI